MEHIIFDVTKNHILALGRAGEHNARKVTFESFERESADHIVYVMVGAPIERMIPLSTDLSFMVQINITKDKATLPMELLEVDANGDLVKKSKMFNGVVETALEPSEEIEVTDPSLDLLYAELYRTYVEIKTAYESGAFKGEPGEPGAPGEPGEPGTDGISPTVSVEDIPNGHRVTITDKDGTRAFEVMNGEDGKDAEPYDDTEIKAEISQLSESITDIEGEVAEKITLADIPIATEKVAGIVRGAGGNGVNVNANGQLIINPASAATIDKREMYPYLPITGRNLDYAVKAALTDGKGAAYTDAEKAAARERLGITGGAVEYSTTEKAIGTWVDGATVYRKCFVLDAPVTLDAGSYTRIFDASEMRLIIDWKIVSADKTIRTGMYNSPSDKGSFAIGYNVTFPLPAGSVVVVEYLK